MEQYNVDVTVIGGGFSGVCAAIAAARYGLKVALIQDRPVFGGNSSSEIGVGINGAATNGHSPSVYAREGGICEELKLAIAYYKSRDIAYFDAVYKEKNIISFLNTLVTDVEMENGKIKAVTAVQLASERKFRFESPVFIDSSGDGAVAYKSGAKFMWGREGKDVFNESLAPDMSDDYTLGDTLMFTSIDVGHKVEYVKPDFAYDIKEMPFFKNLGADKGLHRVFNRRNNEFHGFWWVEYGGQVNTIYDNEDIVLELRKLVYGMWDYIKNSGEFKDVDNLELVRVAPVPGKRESRRFIGDYILTQNDVDQKTDFDDAVATAGWEMDVHAPKGIYDDGPATFWHYVAGTFNIPFGMMYSVNIPNLMFAGRNMSSSHIAFGTTRLACTGGVAGQTVGTAAYLCKKYGKTPREIRQKYISELAGLLMHDDQTIMGKKEARNEELYRDLTISASSTKEYCNDNAEKLINLDKDLGLVLPIKTRLDSFKIKVKNNGGATKLDIDVFGGERKENYIPGYLIKTVSVEVPKDFDDWIKLPIDCETSDDEKLYTIFKANEALQLYGTDDRLTGVISFLTGKLDPLTNAKYKGLMSVWRTRWWHLPALEICFKDIEPKQDMYNVENVLNEYSRPYGLANIWISDPISEKGQQTITINYSKPKKLDEIQLVFNTMLEEDNLDFVPPYIIKNYTLEIKDASGNIKTFSEAQNFKRVGYIKPQMEDVTEIKLTMKENYGSKYFELYGIKMF